MLKVKQILYPVIVIICCLGTAAAANYPAQVSACFTPYQNCTARIVQHIKNAKHSIFMQAYSFTSGKIARALVSAKKRGIKVEVILDKSNFNCNQFSFGGYLIQHNIPVWNDYTANIAHNKVMIFDNDIVETGSFNYTKSAQYYNAENVVFIKSSKIAKQYKHAWLRRQQISKQMHKAKCKRYYY